MRIAICAGHYPSRPGAYNKKYAIKEHDAAVGVVEHLEEMLTAAGHEVVVFEGTLSSKIKDVNAVHKKKKLNLALDIHFNADAETDDTDDKKGYGCEVVYCPGNDTRKAQAAKFSAKIAEVLGERNRGALEGWYWGSGIVDGKPTKKDAFTAKTNCPAFIPEPGFVDNNDFCERFLTTDVGRSAVAHAIFEAITEFGTK